MDKRLRNFFGNILSVIHRLIEFIGRWIFLLAAYLTGPPEMTPPIENKFIIMQSLSELSIKIRQKKIKSEDVVKAYIDRIKTIQPIVNCITEERFELALKEAQQCDAMLNSPDAPSIETLEKTKPFFGVPFTTKDSIAVAGMKQTAGLVLRKDVRSDSDAEAIKLIREAGAIPLATTNISELAMWWESSNYLYGTTRNPYNTWHIVGGSSGGEGCLQASAGSCFGIGSDIGGSIRIPCFFNGIFGHKPSRGIVSNDGQYPCCNNEDQNRLLAVGPMCRFATDLKPILKILADKNISKLNLDAKVDISKLKFYYMEDDGGQFFISPVSPDIKEAMNKVISYLTWGHKVKVEKVKIKKLKKSLSMWFASMASPKGKGFSYELTNHNGQINIWWEFIKWATFTGQHTLIGLITAGVEMFGIQYESELRTKLLQESRDLYQEFRDMLGDDGIFLYPTHPTPAPLHHEPLIKPLNFSYTAIINCLGLPVTACPLGFSNGLPIGIQVIAGLYQDHLTLAVAEELERNFGGWQAPEINKNQLNSDVKNTKNE